MAASPGFGAVRGLFVSGHAWSLWTTASSALLHGLTFALAGWATRGGYQPPSAIASEHGIRAYEMHYLVLLRPPALPVPRHDRGPARRRAPATETVHPTAPTMAAVAGDGARGEPQSFPLQLQELSPGATDGFGQVNSTRGSDPAPGRELAGTPARRPPRFAEAASVPRGPDRAAELVSGVGSACPELRRPATWPKRAVAVAVAFVVDTNGRVDPQTLQVIESPNRPRTEHRLHSHIYIVGATARDNRDHMNPAAYDSVVTREVASHVADLLFRPALNAGRTTRSTVLVSCQSS
jgi:hypothetical protein